MNISIREAIADDIAQLVQLVRGPVFGRFMGEWGDKADDHSVFERKLVAVASGKGRLIVAIKEEEVVGYAAALVGRTRAHLECAISIPYQGRGLGTRLVGEILSAQRLLPVGTMIGVCHKDNIKMLKIFRKYRFQLAGQWPGSPKRFLEFKRELEP